MPSRSPAAAGSGFGSAGDGGISDGSDGSDASDAGPALFGGPARVMELASTGDDGDPSMTADHLQIFFVSTRTGGYDLYSSTRAIATDPWGPPLAITALNGAAVDGAPEISGDGRSIWFTSSRGGGSGMLDLWSSTRADSVAAWTAATHVAALSSPSDELSASLDAALTTIMFQSDRPGGAGGVDLYLATRTTATSLWNPPATVSELNLASADEDPYLSPDAQRVVFSSDRPGGQGQRDLYRAERAGLGGPFGPATPISELNTAFDESDPWLSADGNYILFTSNRSGDVEIYESDR